MNWRAFGVIFLALLGAGVVVQPVERPVWEYLREREPALDLASLEGALGQGLTVGLLGGFRALAANFMWLRVNEVWMDYDLPNTQTSIFFTVTIDPRPVYFWLNGARMIGYDMPVWRARAIGPLDDLPESVILRIDEEQSEIAIQFLQRGLNHHPDHPMLLVDIANLYLRKRHDPETAAAYYRRAAEVPNAPAFAARIYAEILRNRLGRNREAYEWLVELYPTLDPVDLVDRAAVVLDRIRELENDLGIPPEERFDPPFQPFIW